MTDITSRTSMALRCSSSTPGHDTPLDFSLPKGNLEPELEDPTPVTWSSQLPLHTTPSLVSHLSGAPFIFSTLSNALRGTQFVDSPSPVDEAAALPIIPGLAEASLAAESTVAYSRFRDQMLTHVQNSKGRRSSQSKSPSTSEDPCKQRSQEKDEAYWERRRKNNEAAKRSRDARRAKEDEIAIRAAFLEQENLKLRVEVASLKTETAKLRCLLYNG